MSEAPSLTVVHLYENGLAADIAGSMRRRATSIEAETEDDNRTVAMIAVQIAENGAVEVYGWGRTNLFHAMGALAAGIAKIS